MEGRLRAGGAVPSAAVAGRLLNSIPLLAAAAIAAILLAKLALAGRININWDEFLYLSRVHELVRGELSLLFQGAYTHLFRWLTDDGDEIRQVIEARLVMGSLLALSAWLLYRIIRRWASPAAAGVAVLAFLAAWPVLRHGGAFRADSMLLPLLLASMACLTRPGPPRSRDDLLAGMWFGLAFVVTVKAALSLPMLLLVATLPDPSLQRSGMKSIPILGACVLRFCAAAGVTAAVLIAAHATQVTTGADTATPPAVEAAGAALLDVPFAPRGPLFVALVGADLPFWIAMAAGLVIAARQRNSAAVATALALLPVAFYRNAFPYYFPVMMAPATVLVGIALERLLRWRGLGAPGALGPSLLLAACALLAFRAADALMALRFDEQAGERAVVAAVHQVFPGPVPYIDHSGMIASFPKVNFFMSSWGVEAYLRRQVDFMPAVLAGDCPPLLLANQSVLIDGTLLNRQLRRDDRRMLADSYVDYWGPIRVAGAERALTAGTTAVFSVPCSGRYRVESPGAVTIDGTHHTSGDVVELAARRNYSAYADASGSSATKLRLVWGGAHAPPTVPPPRLPLYAPL